MRLEMENIFGLGEEDVTNVMVTKLYTHQGGDHFHIHLHVATCNRICSYQAVAWGDEVFTTPPPPETDNTFMIWKATPNPSPKHRKCICILLNLIIDFSCIADLFVRIILGTLSPG